MAFQGNWCQTMGHSSRQLPSRSSCSRMEYDIPGVHLIIPPQMEPQSELFKPSRMLYGQERRMRVQSTRRWHGSCWHIHATTGVAPSDLFFKRTLRTRLDVMRPSLENEVVSKQQEQKKYHDQQVKERTFSVNQDVMVRNWRPGSKWVRGTVHKKLGAVSYEVRVGTEVWKRHVDQLLSYTGNPMEPTRDTEVSSGGDWPDSVPVNRNSWEGNHQSFPRYLWNQLPKLWKRLETAKLPWHLPAHPWLVLTLHLPPLLIR